MIAWLVSVSPLQLRGSAEERGWSIRRFSSLSHAKTFAREALLMGYRIEAGTADGIEPEIRIRPEQVADWATAPDSN